MWSLAIPIFHTKLMPSVVSYLKSCWKIFFLIFMGVWQLSMLLRCFNVYVLSSVPGAYEPPEGRRRSVQVRFYRNIERAAAVTSDYVLSLHVTTEWRPSVLRKLAAHPSRSASSAGLSPFLWAYSRPWLAFASCPWSQTQLWPSVYASWLAFACPRRYWQRQTQLYYCDSSCPSH